MDDDISYYNLTKTTDEQEASVGDTFSTKLFKAALEHTLFEGKANSKILSFKGKAPASKTHQSAFSNQYYEESDLLAPKPYRNISTAPYKVLDAPDLSPDCYLNILDWGANNLFAVGLGGLVYVLNVSSGEIIQLLSLIPEEYNSFSDYVASVSWVAQGNHIAIGTASGVVQIWDVERKKKLRTMDGHSGRVGSLAWNNFILSSGGSDCSIVHHDVRVADHKVLSYTGHNGEVCGLKWSPDHTQLASGGLEGVVNIWDVNSNSPTRDLRLTIADHKDAVRLAWCPFQANTLATGGGAADRTIKTWNTATGANLTSVQTNSQVCQLLWSTNYRELISAHGTSKNQLTIWQYPTMARVAGISGAAYSASQLTMSPDGETVVCGFCDDTLRFWKYSQKPHSSSRDTAKEPPSFFSNKTIR